MEPENQLLLEAQQQIRELQLKLQEKDEEIQRIQQLRSAEELEAADIQKKVAGALTTKRSKHMDEWNTNQLAAWFTEMKLDEYITLLYKNRVDGLLFINLTEIERTEFGIRNKFHMRKLAVILKAFQSRYALKKRDAYYDEEDEFSEYTPSELSGILEHEDMIQNEENNFQLNESTHSDISGDDQSSHFEEASGSYVASIEEEVNQEKLLDQRNIRLDVALGGDGENFPTVGDIVRVRYTCTLKANKQLVTSTKTGPERDFIEFVLGINQVIKGIDRGLQWMSIGERATLTISAEYAYGANGFPPNIPANASLVFDIVLLSFRTRPLWRKPLIQSPGLSEKPYEEYNVSRNSSPNKNGIPTHGDEDLENNNL